MVRRALLLGLDRLGPARLGLAEPHRRLRKLVILQVNHLQLGRPPTIMPARACTGLAGTSVRFSALVMGLLLAARPLVAFVAQIVDSFIRVLRCIVIIYGKADGGSPCFVLLLENLRVATRYALLTTLARAVVLNRHFWLDLLEVDQSFTTLRLVQFRRYLIHFLCKTLLRNYHRRDKACTTSSGSCNGRCQNLIGRASKVRRNAYLALV